MDFKPMLSASLDGVDLSTLRYPLMLSPKLDGIRGIIWEGVAYSRNAKPIRNRFVQKWASQFHNLDGEFIVGSPTDPHVLNNTQSGVMSFDGEPDFKFYLFDAPTGIEPWFSSRLDHVQREVEDERIVDVPHTYVTQESHLLMLEEKYLKEGYEGVMLRDPQGPYKNGRSTLKEGYLMKLKRFTDGEAVVVRLEEGSHNTNELERDELGRAKRSYDSGGLVGNGMVGTLICVSSEWGELRVAPGKASHAERTVWWQAPSHIVGKTIHWRSFGYGVKDKPRFARFYGVREDL